MTRREFISLLGSAHRAAQQVVITIVGDSGCSGPSSVKVRATVK
jgi:hypothetical protein